MLFDPAHWLSALPDDLPISEINIPGSHNAAAINTKRHTRWTCQDHSITDQLNRGIRLLDIRLKPIRRKQQAHHDPAPKATHKPAHEAYAFTTCHGHLGLFGANEFQSLDSLLDECTAFQATNPTETIIITLQIDDWRSAPKHKHPEIFQTLEEQFTRHKIIHPPRIPTLGECRGKIFLINRINDNPGLGVPIKIPDNTPGDTITPTNERQYEVYVQDQYKRLNKNSPEAHKFDLVINAFANKRPGNILLNFASGTKPFGRLIYIQNALAEHLAAPERPKPLGWLLLDYPFHRQRIPNPVTAFIASNPKSH